MWHGFIIMLYAIQAIGYLNARFLPQFIEIPSQHIFISSDDYDETQLIPPVTLSAAILLPNNSSVVKELAVMSSYSSGSRTDYLNKLPLHLTSSSSKLIQKSSQTTQQKSSYNVLTTEKKNQVEKFSIQINKPHLLVDKSIHILITNQYGTFTSPPIKIVRKVLNPFPLVHHETAIFYQGNIGQVVCMLPHSRPFPPIVQFLFNDSPITDIHTKPNKYKIVYLKSQSSVSAVLLISELDKDDEGPYTCTASLPGLDKIQRSEKITRLKVNYPKSNIPARFVLSSHDNGPRLRNGTRLVEVNEGDNLTLYCLFESAPIREIKWYIHNGGPREYKIVEQFGLISITNVSQTEQRMNLSCLSGDSPAQIFSLRVKMKSHLANMPAIVSIDTSKNDTVKLWCKSYVSGTILDKNKEDLLSAESRNVYGWLHNGQVVSTKSGNTLQIKNNVKSEGVYQCWDCDTEIWSQTPSLVLSSTSSKYASSDGVTSTRPPSSDSPVQQIITHPGVTAHLHCDWSQFTTNKNQLESHWFKSQKIQITPNSNTKYYIFEVGKTRQTLSIINPVPNQDDGDYECRIIDPTRSKLDSTIGIVRFHVTIIDMSSGNGQQKGGSIKKEVISSRKLINKPEVQKLGEMVIGVVIGWRILEEDEVDHCRVEYEKKEILDNRETLWTNEGVLLDQRPRGNKLMLLEEDVVGVLGRELETRFRIVPVLKRTSKLLSSNSRNPPIRRARQTNSSVSMYNWLPPISDMFIKSPWSQSINFTNLLPCTISLSQSSDSFSSYNSDSSSYSDQSTVHVSINWEQSCSRVLLTRYQQHHRLPPKIMYSILYRKLPSNKKSSSDNERISLVVGGDGLVHRNEVEGSLTNNAISYNLSGLARESAYSIAVYGEVRFSSSQPIPNLILPLSAPLTLITPSQSSSSPEYSPETSQTGSTTNRVLFLVLGSLAGVLFVILAVISTLCLAYFIRHKLILPRTNASQTQARPSQKHHFLTTHPQPSLLHYQYHTPSSIIPPPSPLLLHTSTLHYNTIKPPLNDPMTPVAAVSSTNNNTIRFYPSLPRKPPGANTLMGTNYGNHGNGSHISNGGGTLLKHQKPSGANNSPAISFPQPPDYSSLHFDDYGEDDMNDELQMSRRPFLSSNHNTVTSSASLLLSKQRYIENPSLMSSLLHHKRMDSVSGSTGGGTDSPLASPINQAITSSRTISQDHWMTVTHPSQQIDESPYCDPYSPSS